MAGGDRTILYEAVAMTGAQEANKNDMPSRTRAAMALVDWTAVGLSSAHRGIRLLDQGGRGPVARRRARAAP
jgi:hypothetical protein